MLEAVGPNTGGTVVWVTGGGMILFYKGLIYYLLFIGDVYIGFWF